MTQENTLDHPSSIDWELSIKLANNNRELAKDLLKMFIADLPRACEAINSAFEEKHYLELVNQIHRLHGASCYCGVTRLKNILAKMEFNAREKLYGPLGECLNEFTEEVNNILSSYKMMNFE